MSTWINKKSWPQEAEEAGAGYIQDLAILLVTFLGMVKTWPEINGYLLPPTFGDQKVTLLESPGMDKSYPPITDKSRHVCFFFFEKSEKMHGSNILHMIMYFHNFVVSMFEFCWKKSRLKGDGHLVPFHKPSVGFGGLSPGGWLLRFGAPNFHDGVSMGRVRIYLRIYYIRNSHSCGWIYHSHGSVTVVLEYQKVSTPLKTNSQNALKNQWLEDEPFRGHVNFVGGVTPSKCW